MDSPAALPDPELLLAHQGFLRALARELIGDVHGAEDVVQQTWLATLERPPRSDAPSMPWLIAVTRNLARRLVRERSRRARREEVAARERRPLPTPSSVRAQEETRRRVIDALLALDEPYRATLLLRFYEECTLASIALRTGVPLETARTRLRRALLKLRERLDGEFGGERASWIAALAPFVPPILVASKTSAIVAVAAVVLLGATLFVASKTGEPPRPAEPGGVPTPAVVERAASEAPRRSERTELLASAKPGSRLAHAEARFLDRAGRPIEGVTLYQSMRDPSVPSSFGVGPRPKLDGASTMGDAEGRARWTAVIEPDETGSLPSSTPTDLVALRSGWMRKDLSFALETGRVLALGDIVLEPGGNLSGRVVDVAGRPVPQAQVDLFAAREPADVERIRRFGMRDAPLLRECSDADGRFSFPGVPVGRFRVLASGSETLFACSPLLELDAGRAIDDLALTLEPISPDATIEGVVLNPDGTPCPGAEIWASSYDGSSGLRTDGEGRFVHRLRFSGSVKYEARDYDGRCEVGRAADVMPGARGVVLQLRQPRWLRLEVRSDAGTPIETSRAVARDGFMNPWGMHFSGTPPSPGGRLEIPACPLPFRVEVSAPDHLPAKLGPFDPSALPELVPVTLRRIPAIEGRVLLQGEPVANARVILANADARGWKEGFPCRSGDEAWTQTDALGRFRIVPSGSIRFAFIRATASSTESAEVGPFAFDVEKGCDPLELRLTAGGSIEGRVLAAADRSPAGMRVGVSRGDGSPRWTTTGADGSYRLDGLMPGRYDVRLGEGKLDDKTFFALRGVAEFAETPWVCIVEEGRATAYDLDLRTELPARLVGHLRLGSLSVAGFEAELKREEASPSEAIASARLDSQGRFAIAVEKSGRYSLTVKGRMADGTTLLAGGSIGIAASGETRWNCEREAGRLEGRVSADSIAAGSVVEFLTTELGGEIPVRADGTFVLDPAPAGSLRLTRTIGSKRTRVTVNVPVGGQVTAELP